ncbi:MAG TPA: hypothetical protein VK108_00085 [Pseudogracilibacillus sp.]|nr:hypothetical protein [Pseudogracilibacillus sp.]
MSVGFLVGIGVLWLIVSFINIVNTSIHIVDKITFQMSIISIEALIIYVIYIGG